MFVTASVTTSRAQWEQVAGTAAAQRSSKFATRSNHANMMIRGFVGVDVKREAIRRRCTFFHCIGEAIGGAIDTIVHGVSDFIKGILNLARRAIVSFVRPVSRLKHRRLRLIYSSRKTQLVSKTLILRP